MRKIKDTDYLGISARIRAMETSLLTGERMERILEAHTDDEAVKILQECGYPELDITNPELMDAALSSVREDMFDDLADSAPDPRYIDIFKLKYDYHNAKVILKAAVMLADASHMLIPMGRVPTELLKKAIQSDELEVNLPTHLAAAIAEAKEVLDTTRDPQLCDIVLDRWYYTDLSDVAKETGSEFLHGYVEAQIDAANLRTLVRAIRMGKNADFLQGVLFAGGTIDINAILAVSTDSGNAIAELYAPTRFQDAAEAGVQALRGGSLTEFEKLCDDAVSNYLTEALFVPFGEAPLLGYLAARETEYTNLRILLLGRRLGLPADVIRARLRTSYV